MSFEMSDYSAFELSTLLDMLASYTAEYTKNLHDLQVNGGSGEDFAHVRDKIDAIQEAIKVKHAA